MSSQFHDVHVPYGAQCFEPLGREPFAPLTPEALEWLNEHAGTQGKPHMGNGPREGYHCITRQLDDIVVFRFKDPKVALLFKLTFGGLR